MLDLVVKYFFYFSEYKRKNPSLIFPHENKEKEKMEKKIPQHFLQTTKFLNILFNSFHDYFPLEPLVLINTII